MTLTIKAESSNLAHVLSPHHFMRVTIMGIEGNYHLL